MLKPRVILLLLFLSGLSLSDVFRLTFVSGLNISSFRNELYEENTYHSTPGLLQGLSLGFSSSTLFQVSPELLISQKGMESDLFEEKHTLNTYFEVPILFRFYFGPPAGPVRGFAHLGPHFDFLISQSTYLSSDSLGDQTVDRSELYNPLDFGYTVGCGISAKAGPGNILIEFRYSRGFVSLFDGEWLSDNYVVNSTFTTLIGYGVTFGNYDPDEDEDENK